LSFLANANGFAHLCLMTGQRDTDAPYGREESIGIVADLRAGRPLVCPRCKGTLEKGPPASPTSSLFSVVIVRCPTCRRAVFAGEYTKP
jgi:hypothetical protein